MPKMPLSKMIVQLLDAGEGHPLQTWTFDGQEHVTIGRAPENDIVLADPYVSRAHAYLRLDADGWRVISLSKQQVVVRGELTNEFLVIEGMVCRLGQHGSHLRFGQSAARAGSQTIEFDATASPAFQLDQQKVKREADQIAQGEYFDKLQATARRLREQRQATTGE